MESPTSPLRGAGQNVIGSSELDRIRRSLIPEVQRENTRLKQAKELHAKSEARAGTWGNTLEGGRRLKAEERRLKMEREELERQKIDAQEATIQLDLRKQTIDRANKLLYDESDRMKSFHSKMMLCDVLAEREAQVHLKEELNKLEQIRDERFLEMERQNYRKMLERELREKEQKEEISKVAAKAQKIQLDDYKEKRYAEIEDLMLEGAMLKKKAVEGIERERVAEQKKKGKAAQAVVETQKANTYLKQIKAEDLHRQTREEEKIEEYARRKEQLLDLRKQKEEEVFRAKQAARQKMIDTQAEMLQEMAAGEEKRLEKQILEKELELETKRLAKEEKMRRWQEDIDQSRRRQIDRKRAERILERAEDAEMAQFMRQWSATLDAQDAEELTLRKIAEKKLSLEHTKQAEILRRRRDEERALGNVVARRAREAMEADTIEFHGYAETVIREYAEDGKNVIPLIKELRNFRKRVME